MERPVRLGFIGAGKWMQTYHLPSAALLREKGEVELVGIWNKTISKAEYLATEFQIDIVYPSVEALLSNQQLDGVVIAVSRQIARNFLVMALDANLPILIEKPPAESSMEVLELAQRIPQRVVVAFNRVFTPLFQMLQAELTETIVGGECLFHRIERLDASFVQETGVHALMNNDLLFGPGILQRVEKEPTNGPVPRWRAEIIYPEHNNMVILYDFHPYSDRAIERYNYRTEWGSVSAYFHQHYAPDDAEQLLIRHDGVQNIFKTDSYNTLEQQGYLREYHTFVKVIKGEINSPVNLLRTARVMALAESIVHR